MPDLAAIIPLVVSVLGALGIGSVIGQWVAGGKDRRAARAAVLDKLGAVEAARWFGSDRTADSEKLVAAIRELETAALVARVPRAAVVPYAQLAAAGLWYMHDEVERTGDDDYAAISMPVSDTIAGAAEVVSRAAWSTPAVRWFWFSRALRTNRRAIDAIDEERFLRSLDYARRLMR
ncbi:hypothetical protein ACU61A_12515 [Pseudonocardia sichuanensis]